MSALEIAAALLGAVAGWEFGGIVNKLLALGRRTRPGQTEQGPPSADLAEAA